MGRKKIVIEKIKNLDKRYVTFCKRKDGLFKKAETACRMYGGGSQIAIIVFSPTVGKLHTFGPVDSLIHHLHQSSSSSTTDDDDDDDDTEEGKKRSRSEEEDDQLLMLMEERETKKRKSSCSSSCC